MKVYHDEDKIYSYENLEFGTTLKRIDRYPEKIGEEDGKEIFRIKVVPILSNGVVKIIGEEGYKIVSRRIISNSEVYNRTKYYQTRLDSY